MRYKAHLLEVEKARKDGEVSGMEKALARVACVDGILRAAMVVIHRHGLHEEFIVEAMRPPVQTTPST